MSEYSTFNYFKNREDWLAFRLYGIGGSDSSCVVGLNPWKSNRELWIEKVNKVYEEIEDNDAMEYGREAEELIRGLFALKNKNKFVVYHTPLTILTNNEYPFLMYSPDGLLTEIETEKVGIWECKTGKGNREKWDNGKMPDNYFIQCLHGLIVSGYDFVILTAELEYVDKDGQPYYLTKDYRIDRENYLDDLIYLKGKELDFWESVVHKIEPKLLLTL